MGTYPSIGNIARLSCLFTDINGNPADPTTASVMIQPPKGSGSTITATPTKDSTGAYHYDLTLTAAGDWYYRFIGTGAVTARTGDQHIQVPFGDFPG